MTVLVARRRSSPTALTLVAGAVVVAVVVGSACASSDTQTALAATDAWARPTPTGATNGVVYLSLVTDITDSLVSVEVPADVAGSAELHATTTSADGGSHSHGGGGGGETFSMGEVEGFDLSPASPLTFEPGGNHIMLVDVPDPLQLGEQFVLTLGFASERTLTLTVTVADNPPN